MPTQPNDDTFHKARSRLIDAFARLEKQVVILLVNGGRTVKGDTLAAKLKTLRDVCTSDASRSALDRLEQLTPFRADLVHGVMETADIGGQRYACFRNARHAANDIQTASLSTLEKLKKVADEIDSLTAELASG